MTRAARTMSALAVLAASALGVGLLVATESHAGSSAAADTTADAVLYGSWWQPDGTTMTGAGDLTSFGASYTTTTPNVKLTANAASLKAPADNWATGAFGTNLSWYLDTNGDSADDYFVLYQVNSTTLALEATVYVAPPPGGGALTGRCTATARYDGPPYSATDSGYSAEFPASCIDSPSSIRARVKFRYGYGPQVGPDRTYYPYSLDSAPDTGWSASVSNVVVTPPPTTSPPTTPQPTPSATTPTQTPAPTSPPKVKPKLTAKTKPVIHGKRKVGKKLTLTKPRWSAAPSKVSYRWYRSGKAISGATKSTYKVRRADRGKSIKVRVSASRSGYTAGSTTSKAVKVPKP